MDDSLPLSPALFSMQQSEDPLKTQVSPGTPPDSTSPRWPGPSPSPCLCLITRSRLLLPTSWLLSLLSPLPGALPLTSFHASCRSQLNCRRCGTPHGSSQLPHCQHCPPSDGQWPPGSQLACGVMGQAWIRAWGRLAQTQTPSHMPAHVGQLQAWCRLLGL